MNKIFDFENLARTDLKTLLPYQSPPHTCSVRLADNENPYDFPDEVREKIFTAAMNAEFNRYPDTNAEILREKLETYTGVSKENIMMGNGSDELILALMMAFGIGAAFVVTTPTFTMYSLHGQGVGAREVRSPRLEDFSIDVPGIIQAAADPEVKLVIICNPNSPTGNATPTDVLERILSNCNAVVVVDEAYFEFGGVSAVSLLQQHPNLVILRTFSKALSLAGLRVGYLLTSSIVMDELMKVKPPYNVNSFSQLAAITVLDNLPLFQTRVKAILVQRERLFTGLAAIPGVEVFPTVANFIMFRTKLPASQVYDDLIRRGVMIRILDSPPLEGNLRVTVGTEKENAFFLAALRDILSEK